MKARQYLLRCLPVAGLLALASCAETEMVAHTAKQIDRAEAPAGIYKVGRPYQIAGSWYYPKVDYDYVETGIASWYGPNFHGKSTANGETYDQYALTAAHRTLPLPSMVRVTNLENGRAIKVRINDRGPFARGRIIDLSRRAAELLGFVNQGTARVRVEILDRESRELARLAQRGEAQDSAPPAVPTVAVAVQELPASGSLAAAVSAPQTPAPAAIARGDAGADRAATASPARPAEEVARLPVEPTAIFVQAGAFEYPANANRLRARLSALGNAQVAEARIGERRYYRVRLGPLDSVEHADRLLEILSSNGLTDARVIVD